MSYNEQIIENINIGIIVLDRDLVVREWNRWMELHSGTAAADIIGSSLLERYENLKSQKYRRLFRSVLAFGNYAYFSQKLHRYLIPMKNPNPSDRQLPFMQQSCSAAPLRDTEGVISGLFISVHDVTEYTTYENKLLEMTKIDSLTRLYNRSHLDTRLSEELARSRRFGSCFSILMIDLDHFKQINDTKGHPCGDHALRILGAILRNFVREMDFAGRYGGEEFCCVLPETNAASACIMANRLRKKVEDELFVFAGEEFRITVSIGVAECCAGSKSLEALVSDADAALYAAKRNGRNRVECASDPKLVLEEKMENCG